MGFGRAGGGGGGGPTHAICDREVPPVVWATDEPLLFLRLCADRLLCARAMAPLGAAAREGAVLGGDEQTAHAGGRCLRGACGVVVARAAGRVAQLPLVAFWLSIRDALFDFLGVCHRG